MREYKEQVAQQHAPNELIQKTLNRIHEEQGKIEKQSAPVHESRASKKSRFRIVSSSIVAAAAGLAIIISVANANSGANLEYGTIPETTMIRDMAGKESTVSVEVEYYMDNDIVIQSSEDKAVIPEELLKVGKQEVKDWQIYAAKNEEGNEIYVAFEQDGTYYYLRAYNISEKKLERFLKREFSIQ